MKTRAAIFINRWRNPAGTPGMMARWVAKRIRLFPSMIKDPSSGCYSIWRSGMQPATKNRWTTSCATSTAILSAGTAGLYRCGVQGDLRGRCRKGSAGAVRLRIHGQGTRLCHLPGLWRTNHRSADLYHYPDAKPGCPAAENKKELAGLLSQTRTTGCIKTGHRLKS